MATTKFNLPAATIKAGLVEQQRFNTGKAEQRRDQLLREFQFREFLKQLVENGQTDAGLTIAAIYLILADLKLLSKRKYLERYKKLALVTYREDLSWNEISRRVYNQVKNWWLAS